MSINLVIDRDSLQSYLDDIERYSILSKEEEYKLAVKYNKTLDLQFAHTLVVSNLSYVIHMAIKFHSKNLELSLKDLIQEGSIGLMNAVKKFNPYKGVRLLTYATWHIRYMIQEFIIRNKGAVRRGTKFTKKKLFYKEQTKELPLDVSLDKKLPHAGAYRDIGTYQDIMPDSSMLYEDRINTIQGKTSILKIIEPIVLKMNDKARFVMNNLVLSNRFKFCKEVADELGISRERVRQIRENSLQKIRKVLKAKGITKEECQ